MTHEQYLKLTALGCTIKRSTVTIRGQEYPRWRCTHLAEAMALPNVETLLRALGNMPPAKDAIANSPGSGLITEPLVVDW